MFLLSCTLAEAVTWQPGDDNPATATVRGSRTAWSAHATNLDEREVSDTTRGSLIADLHCGLPFVS